MIDSMPIPWARTYARTSDERCVVGLQLSSKMIQYLDFLLPGVIPLSISGSSVGSDASDLSLVSGMGLYYGILSPTSILSTLTTRLRLLRLLMTS
jgi:hypothetical protein